MNLSLPENPVIDRVAIVRPLRVGEKVSICNLDGPGCIRHMSVVLGRPKRYAMAGRKVIIRIYFDGEKVPYVESPVGDFFGVMHGLDYYDLNTEYLSVKAWNGYNCYFPMPFAKSAHIEFEAGLEDNEVYFILEWHRYPKQELREKRRFCARWRKENPTRRYSDDYLILDADGPGQLLGLVYGVRLIDDTNRWSHGGSDNIYVDGEGTNPAFIRGIGGEDSFGAGYGGNLHPVDVHLHAGIPYYTLEDVGQSRPAPRVVGYRFYEPDTVVFQKSIQVRFGCMENEICSTAYWYQESPIRPFFAIPPFEKLLPGVKLPKETCDLQIPASGSWKVTGPFENKNDSAIKRKLLAERQTNEFNWITRSAHHGFFDFNHCWRPDKIGLHYRKHVALAMCTIKSPRKGKAKIRVSWDDHLVITLNNNTIDMGNNIFFRTKAIDVDLRKGGNRLIVKLSNTSALSYGGWAFAMLITLENGVTLRPNSNI